MKGQLNRKIAFIIVASMTLEAPGALAAGGRAATTPTIPTQTTTPVTTTNNGTTTTTTTSTTQTNDPHAGVNSANTTTVNTATQTATIAAQNVNKASNAQNQGKDAGSSQSMGQTIGIVGAVFAGGMAVFNGVQCANGQSGSCMPAALWALGAVASGLMATAMGDAKKKSDQTVADVSGTPQGIADNHDTANPNANGPGSANDEARLKQAERHLEQVSRLVPGLKASLKSDTVKLPNGKQIKVSDLGNKAAMAAAGLSPADIAGFEKSFKAAMKEGEKVAKAATPTDSFGDSIGGGGGGGGRGGSTTMTESSGGRGSGAGPARDPAQVEGLTRNFNGEPIGIASENLFVLINRRYDLQAQKNTFLLGGGAPKAQ